MGCISFVYQYIKCNKLHQFYTLDINIKASDVLTFPSRPLSGESPLRSPSKVEVNEKKAVVLSEVRGSPDSGSEFWTLHTADEA